MSEPEVRSRRWQRARVIAVVALLHLAAIIGLIRAFAPDFTAQVAKTVLSSFSVTITAPPPEPKPEPKAAPKAPDDAGNAGKKAIPKEVTAPKPRIVIAPKPDPQASSSGSANTSGARDSGSGTGADGHGNGTGAGGSGTGTGGGAVTKPIHVSGQIDRASDFPIPPGGREARIGKSVILALTISPTGRATACRVYRPSGLSDTDQVACRLAIERLRFKPATNAAGEPVTGTFYWQQRFYF